MNYKISAIFLVVVFVVLITLLAFIIYPFPITKANVQPYRVITKHVTVGDQLIYIVDICKYMDIESTVTRSFVDTQAGTIYPALVSLNKVKSGCNKTNVSITVPLFLPTSRYYVQLDVLYKINVFSEKIYHFKTEEFDVKGATTSAVIK